MEQLGADPSSPRSSVGLVVAPVLRGNPGKLPLRAIPPEQVLEFATNHTASVQECLTRIFGAEVSPESWEVADLPLSLGGLGLGSAPRVSPAAYWSSWADCLQTTALRQAAVVEQLTTALSNGEAGSYFG